MTVYKSVDAAVSGGLPLPTIHELKSWPEYYAAVRRGTKQFEIRTNDRNFQLHDFVLLREWSTDAGYTGRWSLHEIGYIAGGEVAKGLGKVIVFGISDAIRGEFG